MEWDPTIFQSLIVSEWDYGNPTKAWCLWNADGSFYVDWDIAKQLAMYPEPTTPENMMTVLQVMMARLLIVARGRFTEVTREEARQIAVDAAQRSNVPGRLTGAAIRHFPN